MLDEAHERSLHTDVLFALMKAAVARRRGLRLVVTSATLDADKFSAYFDDCPVLTVPGRSFPVAVYHARAGLQSPRDAWQRVVDMVLRLHVREEGGDVLAFLTGQAEIERACAAIARGAAEAEERRGDGLRLSVLPLYGTLPADRQADVFRPARAGERKVVIATNIAETSLTVDGIRYVVDAGFVKLNAYDAERGMAALEVVPISQVGAAQRAGRAGRTRAGKCYRLYSQAQLSDMLQDSIPEIQRASLATVVLFLKALGIDDVLAFDFLDAPDDAALLAALRELFLLGALDCDGALTDVGRSMAELPLEPALARTMLEAVAVGAVKETAAVAALISADGIYYSRRPRAGGRGGAGGRRSEEEAEEARRRLQAEEAAARAAFRHPAGDHLTYLNLFRAWQDAGQSMEWARKHFVKQRALKLALRVQRQLLSNLRDRGHAESSCGDDDEAVRRALAAGFCGNAAHRMLRGGYRGIGASSDVLFLHPTSTVDEDAPQAEWVIYQSVVATSRPFMQHVLAVDATWLQERLKKIVTGIDMPRLAGKKKARAADADEAGKREEEEAEAAAADATSGSGKRAAEADGGPPAKKRKRVAADAVSAAKARYLARKAAKMGKK
eukprot:PLAT5396.1.p1 GENE.PLAT5396.1~~PLAT5396.1.p1  ORF type:complete len:614 (+),score=311.96 PLAT5396.1:2131-3972(+)